MGVRNIQKSNKKIRFDTILYIGIPVVLMTILALAIFGWYGKREDGAREKIVIAIPYSERVIDHETNYYTRWLEEKTGYDLSFVYLEEGYEKESLNTLLTSPNSNVDAVFLPVAQEILSDAEYQDYIREGLLARPGEYLSDESNLKRISEEYPRMRFENLLGEDGSAYCFPSINMARTEENLQILWINIDWLTRLGLRMPKTTEEFHEVLKAFRDGDPNENGKRDELPLLSCEAEIPFQSYRYLLNAYCCYDGQRILSGDKRSDLRSSPDDLRAGVSYCAGLYREGLLTPDVFGYTDRQLMELVNDPADLVGAFASHSIADVIYTNNPGVLAHFIQLAPLSSERSDQGFAARTSVVPTIGGLLPQNSAHKEAAAQVMDRMLSREASLIALYGEEGVDWRFSTDGELSTYGTRAKITTIRYLKGERQNQNYMLTGPLFADSEYVDGVTWNGDHSMTEYIDARAVKTYEAYYPDDEGAALNGDAQAKKYLEDEIVKFITGEYDIENDEQWERFLAEYGRIG